MLGNGNIASILRAVIAADRDYEVVATCGRGEALPESSRYDLLVEVASPEAVAEIVVPAVESGTNALIASVGALADPALRARLLSASGRAFVATGAIGGLDHVRALRLAGGITSASIESSKLPATLIQPWMDQDLQGRLRAGDERIMLANGTAQEVAALFPRSANVAVAVALAADAWQSTTATMFADPAAQNTRHVITAEGAGGTCRFEVNNVPSAQQPRSSAVVAYSILRSIDTLAAMRGSDSQQSAGMLSLV